MKSNTGNRTTELLAAVFILLWTYTGISKLISIDNFVNVLKSSPMLQWAANVLAWAIPISELCIALLLFIEHKRLLAFSLSFSFMFVFTGYVAYMLLFEAELPCSCGGVIQNFTWQQHLVFNSCLLLLAAVAMSLQIRSNKKLQYTVT